MLSISFHLFLLIVKNHEMSCSFVSTAEQTYKGQTKKEECDDNAEKYLIVKNEKTYILKFCISFLSFNNLYHFDREAPKNKFSIIQSNFNTDSFFMCFVSEIRVCGLHRQPPPVRKTHFACERYFLKLYCKYIFLCILVQRARKSISDIINPLTLSHPLSL